MMLIALFPQIYFALNRGHQWNGANAINHPDEVAYSAYVASLIRGNPRRYDPFTHRGAQHDAAAPESLFSIQFIPPYAIALPAHWLQLSTSTVFIILPALCALASSLAIFGFVWLLTRDEQFSAASVPIKVGLGTLKTRQGNVRHGLNLPYLIPAWISNAVASTSLYHLPFLRLYQPAVAFPLFFVLCALVWIALTRANQRQIVVAAMCAGLVLALLIFSYFYLWTAAIVWLGSLCVIWLIFRSSERKQTIVVFGIILIFAVVTLVPYLRMLSHRAMTVDAAQALMLTHRPDLFRFPEILAAFVLASLGIAAGRGNLRGRDPVSLVAAAFALTVFGLFNQQIVTGRSLQQIHYEWFIGNYCALAAIVLTASLWWRSSGRTLLTNKRLA